MTRKVHYAIDVEGDFEEGSWSAWLGACFYKAWEHGNIDWELSYLWDNNTDVKEEVTCKRCLGMLKNDLWSLD